MKYRFLVTLLKGLIQKYSFFVCLGEGGGEESVTSSTTHNFTQNGFTEFYIGILISLGKVCR